MKEIRIGLLGFGTVGVGVVEGLQRNNDILADRLGVRLVMRKIADLDTKRDRGVRIAPSLLTQDARSVIKDPEIDVVVELIGGTTAAKDLVMLALAAGKPVVTANKALLAEHGEEIFRLAREKNTDIYFGASVGGGIPIIRALREGLIGNRIESISGILNGTCNYILTRMETEGLQFAEALKYAQGEGYAEADPGLDIDGFDTAHKAVILATLAYGVNVPMRKAHVEGIRNLSKTDIRYALDLGYRIKMLAVVRRCGVPNVESDPGARQGGEADEIQVRVHPALVPLDHMLASVSGVFNAVMVRSDMAGDTLYYGRGAGRRPTASTVIADIADVARNLVAGSARRVPAVADSARPVTIKNISEVKTRYYLRLSLLDRPGVLARVSSILGSHGISIASVLQKEGRSGEYVPVVIVTHQSRESEIEEALKKIRATDIVDGEPVRLRIEE